MKQFLAYIMTALLLAGCAPREDATAEDTTTLLTKETTTTTNSSTTTTTTVINDSNWKVGYYVDEFGDDTENSYVLGSFDGTFKNSATNGSRLKALIYLDLQSQSSVSIRLLEYNDRIISVSDRDKIVLKVKDVTGHVHDFKLKGLESDVFTRDSVLRSLITEQESISCVITIDSGYSKSTYNFQIENAGLEELMNSSGK